MAAHPPGPGFPRQAPSVNRSTSDSSGIETISARIGNPAVKPQLAEVLARVLRADQRPGRLVEPIEQPGQEKAQCGAARQQRQRRALLRGERPMPPIALQQLPGLGHIEAAIGLETPSVEADRHVINKKVGASKIEVDQARELAAAEEDV